MFDPYQLMLYNPAAFQQMLTLMDMQGQGQVPAVPQMPALQYIPTPMPTPMPNQAAQASAQGSPWKPGDMKTFLDMMTPRESVLRPPSAPGISNQTHAVNFQGVPMPAVGLQKPGAAALRRTLAELIFGKQNQAGV
jgi:hypothetical protein